MPGKPITVGFDDTGKVHGWAGCDSYGGSSTASRQKMGIGPLMSIKMACLLGWAIGVSQIHLFCILLGLLTSGCL